ncbi:MAG TPA: ABC transporter permease subunit [Polyangiaceae bacterium]|nr:ABC transporter permease subunit [Polyangiaceae bacterium]
MLRHALRRLLWIVPILIGVTLASFAVLSYLPDPADDPALLGTLTAEQLASLRRTRFLDLPRFFNARPIDVAGRVERALIRIGEGDARAAEARDELVRLGGAALPHLLPRLDALPPASRARVAVALAPVAERMGMASADALDPQRTVAFWIRFWTDRAPDFRAANARRAVRRFAQHTSTTREGDVMELDTYALEQIMLHLEELSSPSSKSAPEWNAPGARLGAIARLIGAAAHVTRRDDRLPPAASEREALVAIRRWRDWWLVHQADYKAHEGTARFVAMLTETQYARWAERALLAGFGAGTESAGVLERMEARAPLTLLLMTSALLLAYLGAIALAVGAAIRSSPPVEWGILGASLMALATPTACLAVWAMRRAGPALGLAIVVLALSIIASPLTHTRTLLGEIARSDYIRAARALGYGPARIVFGHALRGALLPVLALASTEMPLAMGATFVVEKAFGIAGLGEETVRAVQTHDVAWLVGLAFITALTVTVTAITADFAVAAADPRLTLAALRHRRMST